MNTCIACAVPRCICKTPRAQQWQKSQQGKFTREASSISGNLVCSHSPQGVKAPSVVLSLAPLPFSPTLAAISPSGFSWVTFPFKAPFPGHLRHREVPAHLMDISLGTSP